MNALERELYDLGFCRSPNNVHGLPSCDDSGNSPIWYSVKGRVLPFEIDLQVCSDRLRLFKTQFFGEQYSKLSYWDTVTVAMFDSVPAFMEWFGANSIPKPVGGANVWD